MRQSSAPSQSPRRAKRARLALHDLAGGVGCPVCSRSWRCAAYSVWRDKPCSRAYCGSAISRSRAKSMCAPQRSNFTRAAIASLSSTFMQGPKLAITTRFTQVWGWLSAYQRRTASCRDGSQITRWEGRTLTSHSRPARKMMHRKRSGY